MAQVTLNHAEINRLLNGSGSPVVHHFRTISRNTGRFARATAPRETGQLRQNIHFSLFVGRTKIVGRIGVLKLVPAQSRSWSNYPRPTVAEILIYQDRGVGPIRPRRSKSLRFRPKGSREIVYASRTSGVPRTEFLVRSFRKACPYPIREYSRFREIPR